MSTTEESDVSSRHLDLCRELNMDRETETLSWNNYLTVSSNFTLEGNYNHWICCSLYAACRESYVPTVGISNSVVRGNCVSLTKLLRSCNISIYEFFNKIKRWVEMANLSQSFLSQVERLERSFGVSLVLYQKYNDIFDKLFIVPPIMKKYKKSRPVKCTAMKLYDFCWCLFLCVKGEEPKHTIELVTSFHLLLCVLDLVYANAIAENRSDIINPSFKGLPKDWSTSGYNPNNQAPICILDTLCKMYDVHYVDAKYMKNYPFKMIIRKFFKHKTLFGNSDNFLQIISPTFFESNVRALNNSYDQFVLSVGEFDERIFLGNFCSRKSGDTAAERERQWQISSSIRTLLPGTPYTRRHLLPLKDISEPVASATHNVKKLQLLAEKKLPTDFIRNIIDEDMIAQLETRLDEMCAIFCQKYPIKSEAKKRFDLAKALYYYLLDKIMRMELKNKPDIDVKCLFEKGIFHTTLITCCVEIVIMAYSSQLKFPWILECFELSAFHFYKIIEIAVSRHEDALTRSIIIHLNAIEEKCLESLVWSSNSTLWDAIAKWNGPMPSWMDVDTSRVSQTVAESAGAKKPDETVLETNALRSPGNSAYDCFTPNSGESSKRELFASTGTNSATSTITSGESSKRELFAPTGTNSATSTITSGESSKRELFAQSGTNSATSTITSGTSAVSSTSKGENVDKPTETSAEPGERKRTNSLMLFCRKLYKLAYMRISELCRQLGLKNDNYMQQIWTLFEYTIVNKTELMRDRHLDQIIMCAIYVFIKVKEIPDKTFTDIMRYYRNQPQAASNVYREVLIKPAVKADDGTETSPPVYNDIIQFYNSIYVQSMGTSYILSFGDKSKSSLQLLLSPHPPDTNQSPRQISSSHQLFIQTLDKSNIRHSPNQITYEFCKSPSKELTKINELVRNGKRTLPFNDDELGNNKIIKTANLRQGQSYISRKIHGVMRDREVEKALE